MSTEPTDRRPDVEKLRKLLEAGKDLHEKLGAVLMELETVVAGGEGIGTRLRAAERIYGELWSMRYVGRYVWAYAKDRAQLKRLLVRMTDADLHRRMRAYLADSDAFVTRSRHAFGLFVTQCNRYAGEDAAGAEALELRGDSATVPDCKHVPPCTTDREHTKKRAADMRGGSHSGPVGDVL